MAFLAEHPGNACSSRCRSSFASVDESTDLEALARDNPWLRTEVREQNNTTR